MDPLLPIGLARSEVAESTQQGVVGIGVGEQLPHLSLDLLHLPLQSQLTLMVSLPPGKVQISLRETAQC